MHFLIKKYEVKVKYFDYYAVESTNDVALEHLFKVKDTDTVIIVTSSIQISGRGRNNKLWFSGSNNLYYTFGFKHYTEIIPMPLIQIIGGLATYLLITEIIDEEDVRLKYPNDVCVKKSGENFFSKIAGVKSEHIFMQNDICTSIIGVGINNKQPTFPEDINAISLFNLNKKVENTDLTTRLTEIIIELIETKRENIFKLWKQKLKLKNKKIRIIDNKTGEELENDFKLKKILDDYRLLVVDNEENTRIIDNGDSVRYNLM